MTSQEYSKCPIPTKTVIFKGDSSLNAFFKRLFESFGRSWRLLSSHHCLWLVQSGTLTCRESRTLWVFPKTLTKLHQDCCLLQNHPFDFFFVFLLLFRVAPLKSSLSPIGSIFYPDMWGVQSAMSILQKPEKRVSRLLSPLKITFYAILPVFDIPDWSFEVLVVMYLFHTVPWRLRSPEALESFP